MSVLSSYQLVYFIFLLAYLQLQSKLFKYRWSAFVTLPRPTPLYLLIKKVKKEILTGGGVSKND